MGQSIERGFRAECTPNATPRYSVDVKAVHEVDVYCLLGPPLGGDEGHDNWHHLSLQSR